MDPPYPHPMGDYANASIQPSNVYGSSAPSATQQSPSFGNTGNGNGHYAGHYAPHEQQAVYQQQQQSPVTPHSAVSGRGPGYPVYPPHNQQYQQQLNGQSYPNGGGQYAVPKPGTGVGNGVPYDANHNTAVPPFQRTLSATSSYSAASTSTPAPASELVSPSSEPSVRTPASAEGFPSSYSSVHVGGMGTQQYTQGHPGFLPPSGPSSPYVQLGGGMGGAQAMQPPLLQEQFTGKTISTREDLQEYRRMLAATQQHGQSQHPGQTFDPNMHPDNGPPRGPPPGPGGSGGIRSRSASATNLMMSGNGELNRT